MISKLAVYIYTCSILLICCSEKKTTYHNVVLEDIKKELYNTNCDLTGIDLEWRGGVSAITYYKGERILNCYKFLNASLYSEDSLSVVEKDNMASVAREKNISADSLMECICLYSEVLNKYRISNILFESDSVYWQFIDTTFRTTKFIISDYSATPTESHKKAFDNSK